MLPLIMLLSVVYAHHEQIVETDWLAAQNDYGAWEEWGSRDDLPIGRK